MPAPPRSDVPAVRRLCHGMQEDASHVGTRPQIPKELVSCEAERAESLHEVRCEECLGCDVENTVMRPTSSAS